MPVTIKKEKQSIITKSLIWFASIVAIIIFNGCNDNSDRMVYETKPVKLFKAEELIKELHFNKTSFKDHVVEVKGVVKEVNSLNSRNTLILKGKSSLDTLIICDVQANQVVFLEALEVGATVTVKGILKGSLKDIILLNCIISN